MFWVLPCAVYLTVCYWHATCFRLNLHSIDFSDIPPVLSKEFLDIQATIQCRFTLKRVDDMIITYSQMQRTDKYSQHCSITWSVWVNGWVFLYRQSGCGFESHCHLNFRYRPSFEQGVPWHSGNYKVYIHSEKRAWHDTNVQSYILVMSKKHLKCNKIITHNHYINFNNFTIITGKLFCCKIINILLFCWKSLLCIQLTAVIPFRWGFFDIISSYFFRPSKVWNMLHHRSVGASSE